MFRRAWSSLTPHRSSQDGVNFHLRRQSAEGVPPLPAQAGGAERLGDGGGAWRSNNPAWSPNASRSTSWRPRTSSPLGSSSISRVRRTHVSSRLSRPLDALNSVSHSRVDHMPAPLTGGPGDGVDMMTEGQVHQRMISRVELHLVEPVAVAVEGP